MTDAGGKKRILVIDDEAIVRVSCERVLGPAGFEVVPVPRAADGLSLLRSEPFDLVLTDLKMPEIDGYDVLRIIREHWPAIPVIVVSGHSTKNASVKALESGAFDFIEKPFTPEDLIAAVRKALGADR